MWGPLIEMHSESMAQVRGPKRQPFRSSRGAKMITRFVRFWGIWRPYLGVATVARAPRGRIADTTRRGRFGVLAQVLIAVLAATAASRELNNGITAALKRLTGVLM